MHQTFSSDPASGLNVSVRQHPASLSAAQEARLKSRLRREAPSEPWVEAQFRTVQQPCDNGKIVVRRFHDTSVFPPGGARTRMVRCAQCKVFNPPGAIEEGLCLDHAEHAGWGPSPSAVAIRGLQYFNLRMAESELPAESGPALRKEIRQTLQKLQNTKK
jgi:hypothetical protein